MYTCGPTVYDFAHIGNFRTFTFVDLLRKWLRASGFQLDHVMNITDVDDKIIRNAVAQHKSLEEYTAIYTQGLPGRLRQRCAWSGPSAWRRATEHIDDMAAGHPAAGRQAATPTPATARSTSASPRFPDTASFRTTISAAIMAGARVDVDEYEKADARDFALWKAPKEGEPFWETPIGPGRPGWHIECSVMAIKYLGETLDIHAGGVDLIFPHHENEIAQSESLTGKPFARFWLHAEFLMVEGQKMSKSLGNFFTLRDLLARGYAPEAIRYLLASVPYRKQLNFTFDGLKSAATAIDRLRNFKLRLETDQFRRGLQRGNGRAHRGGVAGVHRQPERRSEHRRSPGRRLRIRARRQQRHGFAASSAPATSPAGAGISGAFDSIFDVLEPTAQTGGLSDARSRSADRASAPRPRRPANFARADQIRDELLEQGIILEDTKSRRALEEEISLEDPHQSRARGRPQEARRARSRHHSDSYRVQLFLRVDGAARPRLRPRGDGLLLRALRQSVERRAGRTGGVARKRRTARWPAPPAWRPSRWPCSAALADRRKSIVAANALYGATVGLLMNVFEPVGRGRALRRYLRSGRAARGGGRSQARAAS